MESRKHCCVGQCNARYLRTGSRLSSTFLFQFPDMSKDGRRWKLWKSFVNVTRKDFVPTRTSYVCSSHFTEDSYDNCLQYDWAISVDPKSSVRLNLKKTAVPTIHPVRPKEPTATAAARGQRAQKRTDDKYKSAVLASSSGRVDFVPRGNDDDGTKDGVDEEQNPYDEDIDEMENDDLINDPDWTPNQDRQEPSSSYVGLNRAIMEDIWRADCPISVQQKFIVSGPNLLELLLLCPLCTSRNVTSDASQFGAVMEFRLACQCGHRWTWQTAGSSRSTTKAVNALLTGSILYTGSQPAKVNEYMAANRIQFPSQWLFFKYQLEIFCAVVLYCWLKEQKYSIALSKKNTKVVIGGDARCDSMGFCAQYGSYGMMDLTTNRILHIEPIARVETKMSSPAMELEGLVRGLKFLSDANLYVDALVTDQHQGITKYMREQQSTIRHYYDAWHVVKGIRKKLDIIARDKASIKDPLQAPLKQERVDSICRRLYHIASHTDPEYHFSEVMEEKRLAILAHLIGMCEFPQNTYYKRCHHGQLRNERLDPESWAYKEVKKVLNAPQRQKAIRKMSPYGQTSRLESYHRVVLSFAPKHLSFGFQGMTARLLLAALRYNENCNRPVLTEESGSEKLSVSYLKYKGGKGKASKVRPPPTYNYLYHLMDVTERVVVRKDIVLPPLPRTPPSMTSQLNLELQADVQDRYRSRFRMQGQPNVPEPLLAVPSTSLPVSSSASASQSPLASSPSIASAASTSLPAAQSTPSNSAVVAKRKQRKLN